MNNYLIFTELVPLEDFMSNTILVKLFGIGVYNALLGNDRSMDEVCKLINRPRSKKEAKIYFEFQLR